MSLYRSPSRATLSNFIYRAFRLISDEPFTSLCCSSDWRVSLSSSPVSENYPRSSGSDCSESYKSKVVSSESNWISNYGKLNRKLNSMKVKQNIPMPCSLSFRSFVHYGNPKQAESGGMSRSMDFLRGIIEENGSGRFRGSQLSHYNVEQNADILRITMLRNNTFVNLTDSKGQKKPGVCTSTGCLPDRGKDSRYGAEAAAELVGREAKKAGVKAVVVKISGFTHFKKKRQAIMAFREGYTDGRGDQTPIVFIEDKSRCAHNGCRKPKRRRI